MGAPTMRALLSGLYIRAPDFGEPPCEPWSKLIISGFYRDYIGSFARGYPGLYEEV